MPGPVTHLICLNETATELMSENSDIFQVEPKKDEEIGKRKGKSSKMWKGVDEGISQYAYLGSIFPDIPYCRPEDTKHAADLFHYNKSGTFIIKLIDYAKGKGPNKAGKILMAFICGFISHIACDTIVHPYVNTLAGAYWHQLIHIWPGPPNYIKELGGFGRWVVSKVSGASPYTLMHIHMITEAHQDSWLSNKYFGLDEISDAGGVSPSWSGFIDEIGLGWANSITKDTENLFRDICGCFKEIYGITLEQEPLEDSGDDFFEVLDVGYDGAEEPIPDKPSENLVNYIHRANDHKFYVEKAITLSKTLCKIAIDYYHDRIEKKVIQKYLKNWNLDTGYFIRVKPDNDKKIKSIHVKFEHSWVNNFGLYDL